MNNTTSMASGLVQATKVASDCNELLEIAKRDFPWAESAVNNKIENLFHVSRKLHGTLKDSIRFPVSKYPEFTQSMFDFIIAKADDSDIEIHFRWRDDQRIKFIGKANIKPSHLGNRALIHIRDSTTGAEHTSNLLFDNPVDDDYVVIKDRRVEYLEYVFERAFNESVPSYLQDEFNKAIHWSKEDLISSK